MKNNPFLGIDILSSDQFSKKHINLLFKKTDAMRKVVLTKGGSDILRGKIMAALFYEPSSRTFGSFVSAMQRLGGGIIPLSGMGNSSAAKGETFEDTIKTFESYSDVIVIRHPEVGSAQRAAEVASIPIINAGDGVGEHPTQAFYDLYTIKETFKKIENLHIVFFGEIARYRPVNSLSKLLALYPKIRISFVSPPEGSLNPKTRDYLKKKGVRFKELNNILDVISDTDVLYVTRIKKEFMPEELYKKLKGRYIVDTKLVEKMKKKSIFMHALPRIDELSTDVDSDPRAVYLRNQVRNGLYVRMALLALVLGKA